MDKNLSITIREIKVKRDLQKIKDLILNSKEILEGDIDYLGEIFNDMYGDYDFKADLNDGVLNIKIIKPVSISKIENKVTIKKSSDENM